MSNQRKKNLVHLFCHFILLAYTQCAIANRTDLHGNFNLNWGWVGGRGEAALISDLNSKNEENIKVL